MFLKTSRSFCINVSFTLSDAHSELQNYLIEIVSNNFKNLWNIFSKCLGIIPEDPRTSVFTVRDSTAPRSLAPWGTRPSAATVTWWMTVSGNASQELGRPERFQIVSFL